MCRTPASILSLAALFGHPSLARPFPLRPLRVARDLRRCDHDYPRWGEHTTDSTLATPPVLGAPVSLIRSELARYGAPALRFALRRMGERPCGAPPSPSLGVSKHTLSVKKSSIRARKKYPKWGMRSGSPRHYNEFIVEPDAPHPPLRNCPAFLLLSPSPMPLAAPTSYPAVLAHNT